MAKFLQVSLFEFSRRKLLICCPNYSSIQNPSPLKMHFVVPADSGNDEITKSSYAGMVLRQVGSHAKSSQDVVFLPVKLSLNIRSYVEGQFFIPEIIDQDFPDFSMTFLGPWTATYPAEISVISPSGKNYRTNSSSIVQVWSYQVSYFCNCLFLRPIFDRDKLNVQCRQFLEI